MTATPMTPSIWLRLASFYFMLGGALFLGIAALGLISGLALPSPPMSEGMPYPLAIVIVCAMAVALLATGVLLRRRLRAGAVLGLVLTLYPLAFALIQRHSLSWFELGIMALTVIVLVKAWPELERHGSDSVS
jgi:uncharacterized membrane protein